MPSDIQTLVLKMSTMLAALEDLHSTHQQETIFKFCAALIPLTNFQIWQTEPDHAQSTNKLSINSKKYSIFPTNIIYNDLRKYTDQDLSSEFGTAWIHCRDIWCNLDISIRKLPVA